MIILFRYDAYCQLLSVTALTLVAEINKYNPIKSKYYIITHWLVATSQNEQTYEYELWNSGFSYKLGVQYEGIMFQEAQRQIKSLITKLTDSLIQ